MRLNKESPYSVESDPRWLDVKVKNSNADDTFVYAVKTTGIYCRPSCPARMAKPQNIEFFDNWQQAEEAKYIPCKRCHPNGESIVAKNARLVTDACRMIEKQLGDITLAELAAEAGISPYFFHRQFKKIIGITPKQYGKAVRIKHMQQALIKPKDTITDAIYNSGFNSDSRFYATTDDSLGMTPTAFRQGGSDTLIQFAIAECSLGSVLVARSPKGICTITFGDDPEALLKHLQDQFPKAELIGSDAGFEQVVAQVIGLIEKPDTQFDLPLDIRGTAFQQRIWKMLLTIPAGTTVSYTQLAEMIGSPKSVRAVANACGQNMIAVAIPCHRVVRLDGDISGYRWGIDRKRALLARETLG